MSKQLFSSRYIYKINSSELKNSNWNYNINLQSARENEMVISIGDSQLLRFIRDIRGIENEEEQIRNVKKEIKELKKQDTTKETKRKISTLYDKLDKLLFVEDYVGIIFDSKSDFDRAVGKKGFSINGKKYKRLIGTTGGIKQNTVMFCTAEIHAELDSRLENDRNKEIPLIPAKFEAYKALSASVSTPVTKPKGILVIKDGVTHIKDKVIKVSSDNMGGFKIDYNSDYESDKEFCDGCGMILPSLAEQWAIDLGMCHMDKEGNKIANYIPSGFNTRYFSTKGMVGTFDFIQFGREVAHDYIVVDAWGNDVDIREVELVLTTNMVKLWNCYDSIEDYLAKCDKNGYLFSVAKVTPEVLEKKRNMNYQYLQSYEDISDEDISELVKETVDNINGALGDDWAKAVLFAKGIHITDKNIKKSDYDYIRALCAEESVLQDPFVKGKMYRMIEKRIKDAKKGVIQVSGNYQIILGDLYALCESMFGLQIKGLLKSGEFYSRIWSDLGRNEIIAFRSPMTSHNNIKKMNLVDNEEVQKWFKYIKNCIIFNAWDTTTDAMNGCDFDSDAVITTDNEVLLRNTKCEPSIICEQVSVPKVKVTEKLIQLSNKNGFGSDIGQITNRVTTMYDILASLPKDSEEYRILKDRIIVGQAYQQEAIDKIKGIKAKEMPKEWYNYKANKITDEDDEELIRQKELNLKLMVNKKPYFFIYNYDTVMNDYKVFKESAEIKCGRTYGLSVDELKAKENKTEDEEMFLKSCYYMNPVFKNECSMNRICMRIEEEYENVKLKVKQNNNFDYSIYKNNKIVYNGGIYKEIELLYKEYKASMAGAKRYIDSFAKENFKKIVKDTFMERAFKICPNEEVLCNIVVDMAYKTNSTQHKQFAWDICGEQIIRNLLKKNNNKYHYPEICEDGDISYNGYKFKIKEVELCEE